MFDKIDRTVSPELLGRLRQRVLQSVADREAAKESLRLTLEEVVQRLRQERRGPRFMRLRRHLADVLLR